MSEPAPPPPDGFTPCVPRSIFVRDLGPIYQRREPGVGRTMAIFVTEAHSNSLGIAHGGFLMTFMDFAMSRSSDEPDDFPSCVTLSLTTNFLRGAKVGAWLEARVVIERATPSVQFTRCSLVQGDALIATAQGLFKPSPSDQARGTRE